MPDRPKKRAKATAPANALDCLQGGGEAGALARSVNWSDTGLGSLENWSEALRAAASLVLNNQSGMLLWWGPRFIQIYNDAYRPVLGDKHPRAMGQPFSECWAEVFHIVGPMAERPYRGGAASTSDDLPLLINRKVHREESHFRLAYSPVRDATVAGTGIGGVLATVTEITEEAYGARQLRTLRELGARDVAEAKSLDEACVAAAATLRANPSDVPFALFYLLTEDRKRARLAAQVGFPTDGLHRAIVHSVDLGRDDASLWPLREAITERRTVVVHRLDTCGDRMPASPWGDDVRSAIVLPLASTDQAAPYGVLICGLSPHRLLDTSYRTFFELGTAQIVTALRNAQALEVERKRAEALAQIDRAKTLFFSNVSHEFRTPLTLMLGPLQDALASGHKQLSEENVGAVHRNALRLVKLVNSLLDFARIEAKRAQPAFVPTDIGAFTRDLSSTFRSAIERGGLKLEVDCPPPQGPGNGQGQGNGDGGHGHSDGLVYVDREMWEKIVLNLLSNAFKFTFEGSIAVVQRVVGDRLVLEVTDTGTGIPEHEIPRLFERFHRIEGVRARTHEGSGIGLALVQELVQLHGGSIEVRSRLGAGTTFRVSLPLGKDHLPADRIGAPAALSSTAVGSDAFVSEALRWLPSAPSKPAEVVPSASVLVADDNADMRDYVARILRDHVAVTLAQDGEAALAQVRASPPDLIVADVMMPNLDGFGLIAALRADPATAGIPVILLSARAGEEARVEGIAAGADDYLVKPFSSRELLARIQAQLARARSRRAAEDERVRLRALLGQIPAIVNFLRGPELVLEYAHPLTIATLGGRDIVGKPLLEAVPEFADQEYPALLRRVLETGERSEGKEKLVRLADGRGGFRETYWNFVYLPVRDADGAVEGVMTFDLDVTEQVFARRAAESASRAKDEFLAMLGHELRNPLSPIVTSLHLLRMRGVESREHAVIERQVAHLIRLVDDLLDISRITRGKLELRKQAVELGQAVLRGLEIASPLLEQRRQRVDLDVSPEGLTVDGDVDRLAQVVANLLTNAAKYSSAGTTVHVSAERAGDRVRLRVRDEGIGIAPEMQGQVFDIFFQQPQSPDRSKGGLGLGLAIVRSLVELHRGSVGVTSEGVGKGSEFVVELPLIEQAHHHPQLPVSMSGTAAAYRQPGRAGHRVLVVDDNVDAAESLADALRELGYEVLTAKDGPDALRVASFFTPDVCLLDIGLPAMDGYELAQRLRESRYLPERGRLIAITGYGQDADRDRSLRAGFSAHLVKPVSVDVLSKAVQPPS